MNWMESHRADRFARPLADRHYNRQRIGAVQFAPSGSCLVLQTLDEGAVWITSVPLSQYVKHAWPGAWINSLFRRESGPLASVLIREALSCSRWKYGAPPALPCVHCGKPVAMATFVDASKVRHKRDAGRCYKHARFERCTATTKGGLIVWHIRPANMPEAEAPLIGNSMPLLRGMTA